MTQDELLDLISGGSGPNLELRAVFPQKKENILNLGRTLVAFANAKGGSIVIGIEQRSTDVGSKLILGVKTDIDYSSRILRLGKEKCLPPITPEIKLETVADKDVLIISIPEGDNKPYRAEGACYVREGPNTRLATHDEIMAMCPGAGPGAREGDGSAVKGTIYEDLDEEMINGYLRKRAEKLGYENNIPREAVLKEVGILFKGGEGLVPTVAGILLFSKNPQKFLWSSSVKAVRFRGQTTGDMIIDQKELRGTLPELINGAEHFIVKNMNLASRIEGFQRTDIPEYPLEAIREAVTNAVVHRDYSIRGASVRIFMFDDRIEIYTPGGLPAPVTVENIEFTQYSRNRIIVETLSRMGRLMEGLGTGMSRINSSLREAGLKKPGFSETGREFVLTMYSSGDRILHIEKRDRMRKVQGVLRPARKPTEMVGKFEEERVQKRAGRRTEQRIRRRKRLRIIRAVVALAILLSIGILSINYYKRRNNPIYQYKIASTYHADKQYRKAIRQYQTFLRKFPEDWQAENAQYYIASCWDMLGNDEETIEGYEKVIENYPQGDKTKLARYWIAKLYMKQGLLNRAIGKYREAMKSYSNDDFWLDCLQDIAECHWRAGNPQGMIEAYGEMLKIKEGISDGQEYYRMGLCYEKLGQELKAEEMYKKVILSKSATMEWIKKARAKLGSLRGEI